MRLSDGNGRFMEALGAANRQTQLGLELGLARIGGQVQGVEAGRGCRQPPSLRTVHSVQREPALGGYGGVFS